jgi:hypothetical protein
MACSSCSPTIKQYGAEPVSIQWKVVRGNTAVLSVDFLEADEDTAWDTAGWTYKATSYDPQGNVLDDLSVVSTGPGSVDIVADSCVTEKWGTGYKSIVAELQFDLQVVIPGVAVTDGVEDDTIWTPIVGTICVIGNVTPGGSL